MRSLIIRFIDCEGPGIFEDVLREKGYTVTFHDAYKKSLSLIPESHQIFDLILLMGGPQSVVNPEEKSFFKPYFKLVEDALSLTNHKVVGVCLGSQIIAKVLGAEVRKGEKGKELGFGTVELTNPSHPLFQGIGTNNTLAFHYHEDIFDLPKDSEGLISSSLYPNQMFSYKNQAIGILCHLEITLAILEAWKKRFSEIASLIPNINENVRANLEAVQRTGKIIFENILNL